MWITCSKIRNFGGTWPSSCWSKRSEKAIHLPSETHILTILRIKLLFPWCDYPAGERGGGQCCLIKAPRRQVPAAHHIRAGHRGGPGPAPFSASVSGKQRTTLPCRLTGAGPAAHGQIDGLLMSRSSVAHTPAHSASRLHRRLWLAQSPPSGRLCRASLRSARP